MSDLTPAEYASVLGITRGTLARYLRDASLRDGLPVRPYRLPGAPARPRWRFPAAEVERVHGAVAR